MTHIRYVQCKRIHAVVAALWLSLGQAAAHDFWIEPTNFAPRAGEQVSLRLRVGQDFVGDTVLFLPENFARYVHADAGSERPVAGARGDDPAGTIVAGAGLNVIGLHSKKFEVTFDSLAEFEAYLAAEGLERNLALAGKRWKLREGVLETYTRCAKSFIRTGTPVAPWSDRVFGFPLELIAESSPYELGPDRRLHLRLLYQGKPLEAALVVAFNQNRPREKIKLRTDSDGRVALPLAQSGVWLITSVHMIATPLLSRADWESFWASLTFELPPQK